MSRILYTVETAPAAPAENMVWLLHAVSKSGAAGRALLEPHTEAVLGMLGLVGFLSWACISSLLFAEPQVLCNLHRFQPPLDIYAHAHTPPTLSQKKSSRTIPPGQVTGTHAAMDAARHNCTTTPHHTTPHHTPNTTHSPMNDTPVPKPPPPPPTHPTTHPHSITNNNKHPPPPPPPKRNHPPLSGRSPAPMLRWTRPTAWTSPLPSNTSHCWEPWSGGEPCY